MTAAGWLILAGGIAELAGLVLVGYGIRERWRRFEYEARVMDRLRAAMLARPDPPQRQPVVVEAQAALAVAASVSVVGHAPILLPDIESDPQEFADKVRAELNELSIEVKKLSSDAESDRQKQAARIEAVKKRIASELGAIRARAKIDAVFGHGWDFVGLLVLFVGVLVSMIGGFLAAAS